MALGLVAFLMERLAGDYPPGLGPRLWIFGGGILASCSLDTALRRRLLPHPLEDPFAALLGGLLLVLGMLIAPSSLAGRLGAMIGAAGLGTLARRAFTARLRQSHAPAGETIRWLVLLVASLYLMAPYTSRSLVGGGDMLHYAKQFFDFRDQTKAGVFPVLVGQSCHAFNGDIHPLRTAPYLEYVGGLIDLATFRTLSICALLNLTILLHFVAAAFSAYGALVLLVPKNPWKALLLTLLFITSPGVLALIYGGDMVMSWMTLPWLVPYFAALVWLVREPDRTWAWFLPAVPLAALWLGHPPIALWAAAAGFPFAIVAFLAGRRDRSNILRMAGAAAAFALLAGYVFVSVFKLEIPRDPGVQQEVLRGSILSALQAGWSGFLHPVSSGGANLVADVQLSPGLWAVGLSGLVLLWRRQRRFALLFGGILFAAVALLLPLSGPVKWFWAHLPATVLTATDQWPMYRFYVLLSALVPVLVALALPGSSRRAQTIVLDLMLLGLAWSGWEARKFIARGWAVTSLPDVSARRLLPENTVLSLYSYGYYGHLPRYFSNGAVGPWTENRLLDIDMLEPVAKLASPGRAKAPGTVCRPIINTEYGGLFAPRVTLIPGRRYLVRLNSRGPIPRGVLQIRGRRLYREYALPASGEERAFGVGPGRKSEFCLWVTGSRTDQVEMRFIRDPSEPETRLNLDIEVGPLRPDSLPTEVRGVIPYRLVVRSGSESWVETPKIFLPGYAATINGRAAEIAASPDGLLMVRVPAGVSRIIVSYPGSPMLHIAFWTTAISWVLVLAWAILIVFAIEIPSLEIPILPTLGRLAYAGAAGVICILAGAAATRVLLSSGPSFQEKTVLSVQLPYGRQGANEPLCAIDTPRGRMLIFINYADLRHVRIGCASNEGCSNLSGLIPANYLARHRLEIERGSVPGFFSVRFDHRVVLSAGVPGGEAPRTRLILARNAVACPGVAPKFGGQIAAGPPRG